MEQYTIVLRDAKVEEFCQFVQENGYRIESYWTSVHADPESVKFLAQINNEHYYSMCMDKELSTYMALTYAKRIIREDVD